MKQNRVPYSKPIPVKLPPDLLKRIDAVSKGIGEPRSTVMRMAMNIGIGSLEAAIEASPRNLSSLGIRPQATEGKAGLPISYPSPAGQSSQAAEAPKEAASPVGRKKKAA